MHKAGVFDALELCTQNGYDGEFHVRVIFPAFKTLRKAKENKIFNVSKAGREPRGLTPNCGLPECLRDLHVPEHLRGAITDQNQGLPVGRGGKTPAVHFPVSLFFGCTAQFEGS